MADRIRLVPLDRSHLDRTREWANDPLLMRLMDRQHQVSAADQDAWFTSVVRGGHCAYFAIENVADHVHVGNAWLWDIDRRHRKAELRIVIGHEAARGQGMGTEAIDQLCRHGFEQFGLHRIYAYVLSINPAARRAFERAGFALEGTLRDDRWAAEGFVDAYLLARVHS